MAKRDILKTDLYESVKTLIECESPHIHLNQAKLFTLTSIAFQYLLFKSTKEPGAYIIRIEDSQLADKVAKKSKDPSTRKFLQSLMIPRKLKYTKSSFYLDFFHIGSWALTSDIPPAKIKGALIIKNTSSRPMFEELVDEDEEENIYAKQMKELPKDYYLSSLKEVSPLTITIALEQEFDDVKVVRFPFIKEENTLAGVKISGNIDLDGLEE